MKSKRKFSVTNRFERCLIGVIDTVIGVLYWLVVAGLVSLPFLYAFAVLSGEFEPYKDE